MKYALIYGTIAGAVIIAVMVAMFAITGPEGAGGSVWMGYLVMIVALSLIFVGVKRFRDIEQGGVVSFGRAFGVGFGIAVVASIAYVLAWEAYLAISGVDFIGSYVDSAIKALDSEGLNAAERAAKVAELETLRSQYANPLFRLPMTFIEIFPVGLVVALLSALILKNPKVLPARSAA
ncbi:MAG: DUF4199 domain-containing protein [Sphingomonadales bacterium]|nr:DUF4199 domain-containing protein [Sphingomonadales bacterium]